MILTDSTKAAGTETGGQLSQYQQFFTAANNDINNVTTTIANKNGETHSYAEVKWAAKKDGVLVNYPNAGTQVFYLYMELKNDMYNEEEGIQDGEYAIVRVTVHVADVEDSTYVLDYGLQTENLDRGNELFKNDALLGNSAATIAKLMAISTETPSYLDYTSNQTNYNRIKFNSLALSSTGRIWTNTNQYDSQGCWTVKMDIPNDARQITYSAYSGGYSLTDAGTVNIHVDAPFTWDDVYLYWWYNNGISNAEFPGQHMERSRAGKFNMDIPADWENVYLHYWDSQGNSFGNEWPGTLVTTQDEDGNYVFDLPVTAVGVVVANGIDGPQTENIPIVANRETTITLGSDQDGNGKLEVSLSYNTEGSFTVNTKAPAGWAENINLYYWDTMNKAYVSPEWPGTAMGVIHDNNTGENTYTLTIPNNASHVIVNDGTNQSGDLAVIPGVTNEITISSTYSAAILYTQDTVKIHATVPESWKDGTSDENPLVVSLYCWDNNNNQPAGGWPGTVMTLETINDKQWYTLEIPANVTNVIINNTNNGKQTADLTITEGLETWIEVNEDVNEKGHYTARVGYGASAGEEGFFFTPINFMDKVYSLYMAVTVHEENETPTPLGQAIDIHKEVQMYKKITVLPANVVYYEDDFHGIAYDTTTGNNFTYVGNGSGSLKQGVDQKQEYGQDDYYQNGVNSSYSGDHMTKIQINNINDVASFTFSGTGFEIIGRTNATDAGTIMVKVYDAKAYAEYLGAVKTDPTKTITPYMQVPVINEFDNGANGGLDSIEQVPVVRISDITKTTKDENGNTKRESLGYGTYTVVINGIPTYNFDNWNGDADTLPVRETYLYIDGVRIFQPYNKGQSELYKPAESGASFYEIHNMIHDKQVFVISTSTNESSANGYNTIKISGGMTTWTENRNGVNSEGQSWTGNTGSDEKIPETGDVNLIGLLVLMATAMMAIAVLTSRKKFRF